VSEKKQGKKADKPRKVYQAKPHPSLKVKRNADGSKVMEVARGTARAARREGLIKGWKNIGNAKKMAPAANAVISA
jgi:hypothetical protein